MTQYPTTLALSRWAAANFLGWFLGVILIILLAVIFESVGLGSFQFFTGIGIGASVGFFQMRNLKRTFPLDRRWVSAAVLGMGIPFLVFDVVATFTDAPFGGLYLALSIVFGSVAAGVLQSTLLSNHVPHPRWWIVASFLGWTLAGFTVLCMDLLKPVLKDNLVAFFVNVGLILGGGVVLGGVTWPFIARLARTSTAGTL